MVTLNEYSSLVYVVSPMFGQQAANRLRPPQMARFVLPNANTAHLTR